MRLETPVVLMIFNRPDLTEQVFRAISKVRPRRLFIIADGPRSAEERSLCEATRKIVENVDWDCEVLKNFSEVNMGCFQRTPSGLAWVFSLAEEAILLEDDCLPSSSFFLFCQEMLRKYRTDERIMNISGSNFLRPSRLSGWPLEIRTLFQSSYYFSRYPHVWGWATWKRAWQKYDVHMASYAEQGERVLAQTFENPEERKYWKKQLDRIPDFNIWDYQWFYTCWSCGGLSINPSRNLVRNLGMGRPDSTNCKKLRWYKDLPLNEMYFFKHPRQVVVDREADAAIYDHRLLFKEWEALPLVPSLKEYFTRFIGRRKEGGR